MNIKGTVAERLFIFDEEGNALYSRIPNKKGF